MAKIRLDIDALRVESFDTDTRGAGRGTVHGRSGDPEPGDAAFIPTTDWKTCQGGDCTARTLCYNSCLGECFATAENDAGAIGG